SGLRVNSIDGLNAQQTIILLIIFGRADLPGHHISSTQAKAANLRLRHIDIHITGEEAFLSQKAKPILHNLQHTSTKDVALLLSIGLKKSEDEVLFLE